MTYEDRLVMKRYLVTGRRKYRWHDPGTTFEARLDPDAERRAIARGSIRVIEAIETKLPDGGYTLPRDWPERADAPPTRDDREVALASKTREG